MNGKQVTLLTAGLLLALALPAQELSVILEAGSVTRASAPRMLGDRLLFTYDFGPGRHDGRVHSVEVAFAHENFSRRYSLQRNEHDVYVLLYEPPTNVQEFRYRYVVNAAWTVDPANPDFVEDRWGVRLSRTLVPRTDRPPTRTPIVLGDGTVEFVVTAREGARVSVVGSFNGWDPYMTPLTEVQPGRFVRRLRLGSGQHLYYYVVDGLRLPDPGNDERRWHVSGQVVNVVSLP